ncbi:hypothetical protein [Streptomyces sp. NPDC003480]
MKQSGESREDPFTPHLAALAVFDDLGVVVGRNRRARELLGRPVAAVIGRPGRAAGSGRRTCGTAAGSSWRWASGPSRTLA